MPITEAPVDSQQVPETIPSRSGTSPIGTTSPNTGATAATNSTYAQGAFASGIAEQATTAYTVQNTDYQGIIIFDTSSAIAVTLNQAVAPNFTCTILNLSTGQITLTPNGGLTVNGSASLTLQPGVGCQVFFANRSWLAYSGATSFPVVPGNTPGVAHEWLASYNSSTGVCTQTQPAFGDISGTLSALQLPVGVPVVSFGAGAPAGTSTEGYIYFNVSGSPYAGYVYHSGGWQAFS